MTLSRTILPRIQLLPTWCQFLQIHPLMMPSQASTRVKPFICTMPLRLEGGWNHIHLNLADLTRRAYGTNFVEALRVQVTLGGGGGRMGVGRGEQIGFYAPRTLGLEERDEESEGECGQGLQNRKYNMGIKTRKNKKKMKWRGHRKNKIKNK